MKALIWLVNAGERCSSLCSPQMKQRMYTVASTKTIVGERGGRGCTRRHAQGARGRRDQAKACQDQRNQRKARVASAVLLMRRREREGGKRRERENMAGPTRRGINKVGAKKKIMCK